MVISSAEVFHMKKSWAVLLFAVIIVLPRGEAHGQVSFYGELAANYMNNGPYANFLYGGSAGVLFEGPRMSKERIILSGDLQSNFVLNNTEPGPPATFFSPGETYDALTIGPRLSVDSHLLKLTPYVQMNVGFARYHDPISHSSTDAVLGGQIGVARPLTSHFDALLEYSYSSFGYNFSYYHPQTFSAGVIFHLARRTSTF